MNSAKSRPIGPEPFSRIAAPSNSSPEFESLRPPGKRPEGHGSEGSQTARCAAAATLLPVCGTSHFQMRLHARQQLARAE
jgi:hypothetical protein